MSERNPESGLDLSEALAFEQAYDPLEFIEGDDEDWEQDEGALLPNALPEEDALPRKAASVYSPERAGSVAKAVKDLVGTNKARRDVLVSILDWARDGEHASVLFEKIEAKQEDNRSVYEPVSYCRMLERAGALTLDLGETRPLEDEGKADSHAPQSDAQSDGDAQGGIAYLTIDEEPDPIWRTTEEGLAVYEELIVGTEWRETVLGSDSVYAEVYRAVMELLLEGGRPKGEIAALAETFEVTKVPLKYGNYFIDVLEATCAIRWSQNAWNLTDLGRRLLPELQEFCARRCKA